MNPGTSPSLPDLHKIPCLSRNWQAYRRPILTSICPRSSCFDRHHKLSHVSPEQLHPLPILELFVFARALFLDPRLVRVVDDVGDGVKPPPVRDLDGLRR